MGGSFSLQSKPGQSPKVISGKGLTTIDTNPDAVWFPSVTSTIYVVETDGLTTGLSISEVNPSGSDTQLNDIISAPPVNSTLSWLDSPAQTVSGSAVAVTERKSTVLIKSGFVFESEAIALLTVNVTV